MGFVARVKDGLKRAVSKAFSLVSDTNVDWGPLGMGEVNTYRNTRRWVQTYKSCTLLGSVIGRIAEDVARGDYRFYQIMGEAEDGKLLLKVVHKHPFWKLWQNPNPDMTGREFRKLGMEWLETSGFWCSWIEREGYTVDEFGRPVPGAPKRLWPIEPWHVIHRPFSYSFALLAVIHIAVVTTMGYVWW